MADVTGKYFIVSKHKAHTKGRGRKKNIPSRSRRFYEQDEIEAAREQARALAEQNGEDFLIVQVIAEASKPAAQNAV